jgi:hypothetical protein
MVTKPTRRPPGRPRKHPVIIRGERPGPVTVSFAFKAALARMGFIFPRRELIGSAMPTFANVC